MTSLRQCPFCANPDVVVQEIDREQWAVVCPRCGAIGPQHPTPHAAVRRWNNEQSVERRLIGTPILNT